VPDQPAAEPLTRDELSESPEWTVRPEGARLLWEEGGDAGEGHGFDNLDPSAFIRGVFQAPIDWLAVRAWYRERLEALSWIRRPPAGPISMPYDIYERGQGELWVIERPRSPTSWTFNGAYDLPGAVYEVYRKVRLESGWRPS
jgi:hypothetical protein